MTKTLPLKSFWKSLQKHTAKKQMRSLIILLISILGTVTSVSGQVINYTFREDDNQTYSEITGGSTLVAPGVNFSNAVSAAVPLGFNFNFNGANKTSVFVAENGFVTFDVAPTSGSFTSLPISASSTYSGAIACYGNNLQHASSISALYTGILSEVRFETIGSAPNRIFVVQYKNVIRTTGANAIQLVKYDGLMNMQIRLYEGTNVIETWYKDFISTNTTSVAGQVGLRGALNTDYKNRKNITGTWPPTAPGTQNTDFLNTSSTLYNATTAKFTWTPPCYAPVSIAATLQADNASANITWSDPPVSPASYNYEVRTSGAFGSGTTGLYSSGNVTTSPTVGSPIVISGLVPGVTYTVYARSSCGGTVVSTSVIPVCPAVTSLPYTQDFESVTAPAIPICNSVQMIAGATMVTKDNSATPYYGFNSKNITTSGALATDTWFFTQKITFPAAGSYKVSYKYGGTRALPQFIQKLNVAYGATNTASGMTNVIAIHDNIKESPLTNTINFYVGTAGDYYIGFRGYADANNGFLQIDDIVVDVSTCQVPTALSSGQIASNSAIISWTAPLGASGSGYQYYFSTSSITPINTTIPSGSTVSGVTLANIASLDPSTLYYFWVRTNCGNGDISQWSAVGNFTTTTPYVTTCNPNPSSVDGTGITNVSFGSVNNTTSTEAGNYGNYSNLISNVSQGTTLNVGITFNTGGFNYNTKIWIDWNNDGDFVDTNELMYTGLSAATSPNTLNASFLIPLTVNAVTTLGQHRMRIGGADIDTLAGTDAPCYSGTWGTFEDYSIYVTTPPPALTIDGTAITMCSGSSSPTIHITTPLTNFQVYSWNPTAGVNGDPVNGYTFNPTTTTNYTLTATKTDGIFVSNSSTYNVTIQPLPSPITIVATSNSACQNGAPVALVASGGIDNGIPVFTEDFNGATTTFTSENTSAGGNTGAAGWAVQQSPYAYSGTTFVSNDSSKFYISNSDAQGSGTTTNTVLTSPAIDLSNLTDASLSFWHYYRGYGSGTATAEISIDNGTNWAVLPNNSWTTANAGTATSFVNVVTSLTPYVGQGHTQVKIRFKYTNALWAWYWAIDNVKITGSAASQVVWSPIQGLFTNPAATVAYTTGTPTATVYVKSTVAGNLTYTASVTSLIGCVRAEPYTLTVYPSGQVNQPTNVTFCNGEAVSAIPFTTTNTGGIITYDWTNSNTAIGLAASGTGSLSGFTASNATNFPITATITITPKFNGCVGATKQFTITVNPNPSATISGSATICSGSTSVISFSGTPNTTVNYTVDAVAASLTLNGSGVGSVTSPALSSSSTYSLVDVGFAGTVSCSQNVSGTEVITVLPLPTVAISGAGTICPGNTATITFVGSPNAVVNYTVDGTPQSITLDALGDAAVTTPILNANSTYTLVSVAYPSAPLCSQSVTNSVTVSVNASPTATIATTPVTTICSGTAAQILFTGSPNTIVTYTKDAGTTTQTITFDGTGIYELTTAPLTANTTFTLINVASGSSSCSQNLTESLTITVLDLPTATISGATTICAGTAASISFNGTPNAVVNYNVNGTPAQVTLDATLGTASVSTGNLTAQATYTLTGVTSAGTTQCTVPLTDSVVVNVNALPTVAITGISPVCTGSAATITFTGTPNAMVHYNDGTANQMIVLNASGTNSVSTGALTSSVDYTLIDVVSDTTPACTVLNTNSFSVVVNDAVGGTASSDQSICSGAPNAISVSGYVGTVSKWQYASDLAFTTSVDIQTSASATLSSAQIGNLVSTRYYRAVISNGACTTYSNVVTISVSSTVWENGNWSNGNPTSTVAAIFNDNYTSTGDISACSVKVINGNVTFLANHTLLAENNVEVLGGSLTFNNDASLVQINNTNNIGDIVYNRNSRDSRLNDYNFWASPVDSQVLNLFSPSTAGNQFMNFDTVSGTYVGVNELGVMNAGLGYAIGAPSNFTSTPAIFNGMFYGVPNNGPVATPITIGTSDLNLVGNPYPSAISANDLLSDAANTAAIDGTVYFLNNNFPSGAATDIASDYAVYNYTGGIGTTQSNLPAVTNPAIPNGKIAAAQGFFVRGLNASGTLGFKNSMRVSGNNSQYFRNTNSNAIDNLERHRIWLEISNAQGAYKQTMVGYVENATNGIDRGFDSALLNSSNPVSLYSVVNTSKLAIQGKALPFDTNDLVPLGFNVTTGGTYQIKLSDFDGLFSTQGIYLQDNVTQTVHDFSTGSYSFTTATGTFEDRFILKFSPVLGTTTSTFTNANVIVYKQNDFIHINAVHASIQEVSVFDITGRLLYNKKNVRNNNLIIDNLVMAQQVILINVLTEEGQIVTKKIQF